MSAAIGLTFIASPMGIGAECPNAPKGHAAVAALPGDRDAVVCFESTGGQEWQLWAVLEAEGLPPAKCPRLR
jgi:transposase